MPGAPHHSPRSSRPTAFMLSRQKREASAPATRSKHSGRRARSAAQRTLKRTAGGKAGVPACRQPAAGRVSRAQVTSLLNCAHLGHRAQERSLLARVDHHLGFAWLWRRSVEHLPRQTGAAHRRSLGAGVVRRQCRTRQAGGAVGGFAALRRRSKGIHRRAVPQPHGGDRRGCRSEVVPLPARKTKRHPHRNSTAAIRSGNDKIARIMSTRDTGALHSASRGRCPPSCS